MYLIACHCKQTHEELFLRKNGSEISLRDPLIRDRVTYVNPSCKDGTLKWDELEHLNGKIDTIWTMFCPIYLAFNREDGNELCDAVSRDILVYGWDLLKPGGKIYIPMFVTFKPDPEVFSAYKDRVLERVYKCADKKRYDAPPWNIYFLEDDFPFTIFKKSRDKLKSLFVFEKPARGGRKKGQRSTSRAGRSSRLKRSSTLRRRALSRVSRYSRG